MVFGISSSFQLYMERKDPEKQKRELYDRMQHLVKSTKKEINLALEKFGLTSIDFKRMKP